MAPGLTRERRDRPFPRVILGLCMRMLADPRRCSEPRAPRCHSAARGACLHRDRQTSVQLPSSVGLTRKRAALVEEELGSCPSSCQSTRLGPRDGRSEWLRRTLSGQHTRTRRRAARSRQRRGARPRTALHGVRVSGHSRGPNDTSGSETRRPIRPGRRRRRHMTTSLGTAGPGSARSERPQPRSDDLGAAADIYGRSRSETFRVLITARRKAASTFPAVGGSHHWDRPARNQRSRGGVPLQLRKHSAATVDARLAGYSPWLEDQCALRTVSVAEPSWVPA